MKEITVCPSFKPSECSFATNHDAVTVGAGVQGRDILTHLVKHDPTTVVRSNMVQITQLNSVFL